MSLLRKIVTALRGGASEVGEAIVDSQALRILDQEIRDADNNLIDARNQLVKIMAKHKTAQQRITEFDKTIGDWEQKAIAALDKGEEGLAHECAARIADLTNQRDSEQALADQFGASVTTLTATVSKTEAQIKGLKQQVDLVKARESVQRAQVSAASATGGANGSLETAVGSLDRIKKRQTERAAELEAAAELAAKADGSDLEARLKSAGIGASNSGADDVLARLKAKAAKPAE
ncbi:PspA/IM30 family protein [Pseudomonas soli]|jgi:phage shock protein A|uniref:Phage shock protein A (PspA) family protein n=1 Tax=Pseudomonas soli TaxID=1306993 RepID=A0A1H9EHQ6_9PSED|nr:MULTISPECIES: PspA/IM30 family protein [Pseudomonas]AIN57674.1 phage shock protein A (IM30), suppresses sigma54-dependent transcription [Pseudomonas soli]AUY32849.1 phage shock protein A [Pseudomonas sp. PONIH3]MCX5508240.1 PspA/IM30 family protein [Pseudomonas sp. BJa3]MDT3712961.1 PspA/IM30 family protein [Pseudomonas soli]MDT3730297.1 PspA/IM30 family protein [Pseudomonas soli]